MKSKTAIRAGITPINYKLPIFSWEKPIEQEILEFCKSMASQMEKVANKPSNGLFGTRFMDTDKNIREGASHYAKAYRNVENHIIKEMKIRRDIEDEQMF